MEATKTSRKERDEQFKEIAKQVDLEFPYGRLHSARTALRRRADDLNTHLGWVMDIAMRCVHTWEEAFQYERERTLAQLAAEANDLTDGRHKHQGMNVLDWRIHTDARQGHGSHAKNGEDLADQTKYLRMIDRCEEIYNEQMKDVRPLLEQAHANVAECILKEFPKNGDAKQMAKAVAEDDPLEWLNWDGIDPGFWKTLGQKKSEPKTAPQPVKRNGQKKD